MVSLGVFALFPFLAAAQRLEPSLTGSSENFDIRTDRATASTAFLDRFAARQPAPGIAALSSQRTQAVARLRADFQVDLIDNPEMGTTEVVSAKPGSRFLTGPTNDRVRAMRSFLSAYNDVYGLSAQQVGDLVLVSDYANPAGNMAWVEFEQRINGIPVFQGVIRGGFTAAGELVRTTGPLASGLNSALLPVAPVLSAADAVSTAAQSVGWSAPANTLVQKRTDGARIVFDRGPLADDSKVWPVYFPLGPGVARLAWATEIWGNPDAFLVVLDAENGTVLFRKNLTDNELQAQNVGGGSSQTPTETPADAPANAVANLAPGVDLLALRAFMKTGSNGSGNEVAIPAVGQTVFFHLDLQVWGVGGPVNVQAQARLDGAPYCTVGGAVPTGSAAIGSCQAWVVTAGSHTLQWTLDPTLLVSELDETNNTASKSFTSSTFTSDLVAQRSYMRTAPGGGGIEVLDQPKVGETVVFTTDWQFTGTGAASTVTLRAVLDGTVFCGGSLMNVAPSSTTNTISCSSGWVVTGGQHTVQWDFDYNGEIGEQDEGNNSIFKIFTPGTTQGTQSATYAVYLDDSPAPLSPSNVLPGAGTQAPVISRTLVTLVGNEPPNTFNNLGWIKDGANVTDGNNVEAGIDRDFVDGVDAPVSGVNRVFNFSYDTENDSPLTPAYQKGEVTDMFYWANVHHDRLYLLGFTEAAGNFQNDNFGRGGVPGDRIRAEGQDLCSTSSCSTPLNNANFSTPTDGGRGRMQMYLYPGPNPPRTSGIDHDVVLHELTHGASNRLHNNAAGLTSTMSKGMGEGWSDFYARALLSTADEDPNGIYPKDAWSSYLLKTGFTDNYYYGVRRFPYAVLSNVGANGKPHNPLTFADIDPNQVNTTDGAFPPLSIFGAVPAFEVHNSGEIWCMALLEVRARYINRLGFAVGNQRFLQFVTDGMKLDPINPTFLQGRDSILTAASTGGGTPADIRDIWSGFAIRGMGVSAQVLDAATGSVIEAFDAPTLGPGSGTLVTESIPNGNLDPGESVTASLCLTNISANSANSVTGTLLATGGLTSPSAPQSYGVIPALATVCRSYTFTVVAACGATVTATLQTQEGGGPILTSSYSFTVGTAVAPFAQNFDAVMPPALPMGWSTSTLSGASNLWVTSAATPHTAPNKASTGNPAIVSDNVLTSPTIAMPPGLFKLTFRNFYDTETNYDGGVLEIAIAGAAFQDIITAGGSFIAGGYNGAIPPDFSNPLGDRQAWTGNAGAYLPTTVNMPPSAAGQNIRLRWRMGSDDVQSANGWSVDSISLSGFQCGVATVARRRGQITSN
jgi:hypothetical protein